MNFAAKTALASFFAIALVGCGAEQAAQSSHSTAPVALDSQQSKHSYALGTVLGEEVTTNLEHLATTGIELDKEVVLHAISDAILGKSQMSEEDVQATIMELVELSSAQAEQQLEQEAQQHLEAGLAYQAENAQKDGVQVTESGLQYEVLTAGDGDKPALQDTVTVHYEGTLIDGTVFDSSYQRGEPIAFPLDRVIQGWSEGVQLMPVGSKYRFVIPSELAYGEQARPGSPIPGNATLVFEVELLEIEKYTEEDTEEDAVE